MMDREAPGTGAPVRTRPLTRVLVTGGAGTIGSAVVRRLLREPEVTVRVADSRAPAEWMARSCEVFAGDLRDLAVVRRATKGCTHVIHLAAIVGGIANFHKLPFTLTELNNQVTGTVAHASIDEGVQRFVYVSSSMVFENATEFPTTEASLPRCPTPTSAYGFSKLSGEVYTRAAHDQHGLPFTICRPFNAYGPGELPDRDEPGIAHMVPDIIAKVQAGASPLPIFGSGAQTRTLTHVDDIADGIVAAMRSPAGLNEDFNISASEERTVAEICALIWEVCGRDPAELSFEHLPSFTVDVVRRWPSVEKARTRLGWQARIPLRDGLAATAAWLAEQS